MLLTNSSIVLKGMFLFLLLASPFYAAHAVVAPSGAEAPVNSENCTISFLAPLGWNDIATMHRKEIEQQLGKKLKLKERMVLKIAQRKLRRMETPIQGDVCYEMERKAANSVTLGLIGIFVAQVVIGIIAIVTGLKAKALAKKEPNCKEASKTKSKGTTGVLLGVLDLLVAALLIVLLI